MSSSLVTKRTCLTRIRMMMIGKEEKRWFVIFLSKSSFTSASQWLQKLLRKSWKTRHCRSPNDWDSPIHRKKKSHSCLATCKCVPRTYLHMKKTKKNKSEWSRAIFWPFFYLQNIEGVWLVDKTVFEFCFAENS